MERNLLLVFNPKSGKGEFTEHLWKVVDKFVKGGFRVTVRPTQSRGDACEYVAAHADEYQRVVCCGGDGTVSEVLEALASRENPPELGYIPAGTTNDFAASLGIPRDVLQAADVAVQGREVAVDVGRFGQRTFSYVAAFGLFTDVTYDTSQNMKNILGHAAYMLEAVKRLGSIQAQECRVELGDEVIEGEFLLGIVSNATSIGGFQFMDKSKVRMDDGLFEVLLVKRPENLVDVQEIITRLMNRQHESDAVIVSSQSRVRFITPQPVQWTLDGEYGGETTDVLIENLHRGLRILVPAKEEGGKRLQ